MLLVWLAATPCNAQVTAPTFSPPSGDFPVWFDLTVNSSNTTRYTLDGATPDTLSLEVPLDGIIRIGQSLTLSAATWDGSQMSLVTTGDYRITGKISGGGVHSLWLRTSGHLLAFGQQAYGRLGNGLTATASVTTPQYCTKVGSIPFTDVVDIAAGSTHSLALQRDGTVWAFGDNVYGQIGDGSSVDRTRAVKVLTAPNADLVGIDQIAAGPEASFAVDVDGNANAGVGAVWAWGSPSGGRLGNGEFYGYDQAYAGRVEMTTGAYLTGILEVTAGGAFALGLGSDGKVWSWGSNTYGQLASGDVTDRAQAAVVKASPQSDLSNVVAIAQGNRHGVAIRSTDEFSGTGTVWCWGSEVSGRLGNGITGNTYKTYPQRVMRDATTPLDHIEQVVAATGHTLALAEDGRLWSWGLNGDGQLGWNGTTNSAYAGLVLFEGQPLEDIISIGAGGNVSGSTTTGMSYAIAASGSVYVWGGNVRGQLGDGSTFVQVNPVEVNNGVVLFNRPPDIAAFGVTGSGQTGPATVSMTASATDADGDAITVKFYANGTLIATDTQAPFEAVWQNVPVGSYAVTAVAMDAYGAVTTSDVEGVYILPGNVTLMIAMPHKAPIGEPPMIVQNARPSLGAMYGGDMQVQSDSFKIFLDNVEYSAEAMIEYAVKEVMYMPTFDLADGDHTYRIELYSQGFLIASDQVNFNVQATLPVGGLKTHFTGQVMGIEQVLLNGVLQWQSIPLASVRVRVVLPKGLSAQMETRDTMTLGDGTFVFEDLPDAELVFEFETSQVPGPKKYAPVATQMEVLQGKFTHWERPIFLPRVDESKGVAVPSVNGAHTVTGSDLVVTNPDLPGVRITIPVGTTLTFPNAYSGIVTLIEIPPDRSPNCLGVGVRVDRLFSVQPENTRLSQPAKFTTPNTRGYPEGAIMDFYSLNRTTGLFGAVGKAKVINGEITTESGSGLVNFDWHGPQPGFVSTRQTSTTTTKTEKAPPKVTCSTSTAHTGELMEDHSIPSYSSLGVPRNLSFHYSSTTASPDAVVTASLIKSAGMLSPNSVELSFASQTPLMAASTRYVTPPTQVSTLARKAKVSFQEPFPEGIATGFYTRTLVTKSHFDGDLTFSTSERFRFPVVNSSTTWPGMGVGWSISNVDQLVIGANQPVGLVTGQGIYRGVISGDKAFRNLSFENENLTGLDIFTSQPDPNQQPQIISDLGSIRPVHGSGMYYQPVGGNSTRIFLGKLSDRIRRVTLWVNVLSSSPSSAFNEDISLWFDGFRPSNPLFQNDYINTFQIYTISQQNYHLTGADSGYLRQSGWRKIVLKGDVKYIKNGNIDPNLNKHLVIDTSSYTSYPHAVLLDDIRFEYYPGEATQFDGDVYNIEEEDFSKITSVNGEYAREFRDGSKQVFDSNGRQVRTSDRVGNTTQYQYGDIGNGQLGLVKVIDPVQLETILTYQNSRLDQVTDPAGRVTKFRYTGNRLTKIINPDLSERQFGYDATGRMSSQTEERGFTRFYTYRGGRLETVQRADGKTYHYEPSIVQGLVDVPTTSEARASTTPRDLSYEYPIQTVDAENHTVTEFTNPRGLVRKKLDALNRQVVLKYDANDLPTEVYKPDGSFTWLDYDTQGNPTRVQDTGSGAVVTSQYALKFSLPKTVTDPMLRETQFYYDQFDDPNVATNLGKVGTAGLLRTLVTAANTPKKQITRFTYHPNGQIHTTRDPQDRLTTYTYDAKGRVDTMTDPNGRVWTYGYVLAGEREDGMARTITDPEGRVSTFKYDDMGRLRFAIAPDGGVTQYQYDAHGNRRFLIDANLKTREWRYDSRNRLVKHIDALGRAWDFRYDGVSNLRYVDRPDGTTVEYVYNDADEVVMKKLPALPGVPADTIQMVYEPTTGRLDQIIDADSVVDMDYDAASRVDYVKQTFGGVTKELEYKYDVLSRRWKLIDAGGTVEYLYDDLDRLEYLKLPGGTEQFEFKYDAASRLDYVLAPNGVKSTYNFDPAGQLLSLIHAKGTPATTVASTMYQYIIPTDPAPQLQRMTRRTEEREDGNLRTFGYDDNYRLETVTHSLFPPKNETFAYDVEGNRQGSGRDYDDMNALTEDATYDYTYDQEGNLTSRVSKTDTTQNTTYLWDAENRLIQVTINAPPATPVVVGYRYDGLGRRVAKLVNGTVIRRYVLDDQNVRQEYDGNGALAAINTHAGLDNLLRREDMTLGQTWYVHPDGLGSTIALTNPTGDVVERYRYSSFGNVEVLNPDFSPKAGNEPLLAFTYAGREWEPEVRKYFCRARFFDPELGRFISRDPIGDAGGRNVYAYAANQPISLKDINGLAIYPTDYTGPLGPNDQRGFTAEQYNAVVEIIQREQSNKGRFGDPNGTTAAAYWGSNTLGQGGLGPFNNDRGNGSIDKKVMLPQGPIDLEWFTDVASITGNNLGTAPPAIVYTGGKLYWMIINLFAREQDKKNVIGPFQQEDENNAVWYLQYGWTYEELFSPSVMRDFRPKCP